MPSVETIVALKYCKYDVTERIYGGVWRNNMLIVAERFPAMFRGQRRTLQCSACPAWSGDLRGSALVCQGGSARSPLGSLSLNNRSARIGSLRPAKHTSVSHTALYIPLLFHFKPLWCKVLQNFPNPRFLIRTAYFTENK